MLRISVYVVVLVFVLFSCRRGGDNSEASRICDCYDQIHNESMITDSELELQQKVAVCNDMLSSKLASFGADEEQKSVFMEEFRTCQEN
jgi:hypothetical protein